MSLDYSHHHRTNMMESADADDAAFYAELTKQILHLMDEDHEETHSRNGERRSSVVRGGSGSSVTSGGNYFSWWDESSSPPSWMERLWSAGNSKGTGIGTGVFIPQVVAAGKSRRRRHNRTKKNNNNNVDGGRILHSSTAGNKIIHA